MKKIFLLISLLFVLTACSQDKDSLAPAFDFDQDGNYIGFNSFDETDYDTALEAGYYALRGLSEDGNIDKWNDFITASDKGDNASIRIIKYNKEDETKPILLDLFYEEGKYYLFDNSSKDLTKTAFTDLFEVKGKFGNPAVDSGIILLGNDRKISFDQFIGAMFSSDSDIFAITKNYRVIRMW